MTNTANKEEMASRLAALFEQQDDLNVEIKALLEIAKCNGVDAKNLRKAAE